MDVGMEKVYCARVQIMKTTACSFLLQAVVGKVVVPTIKALAATTGLPPRLTLPMLTA